MTKLFLVIRWINYSNRQKIVYGYKNFDNTATNVQSIALLTGGEGLHNNHHGYPRSPKLSYNGPKDPIDGSKKKRELDPAWPIIKFLLFIGQASEPYKTIEEMAGQKESSAW